MHLSTHVVLSLAIVFSTSIASAIDVEWFSQTYARSEGSPAVEMDQFSAESGLGELRLANGGAGEEYDATSARVVLNGVEIFGPDDFKRGIDSISVSVTLEENNRLDVRLAGKPGSGLGIVVMQSTPDGSSSGSLKVSNGTRILGDSSASKMIERSADGSSLLFDDSILTDMPPATADTSSILE